MSSGNSWGEQLGGNKPPAQGPGPGGPLNGEDPGVPNIALQRQMHQQQQLQHLMQQVSSDSLSFSNKMCYIVILLNDFALLQKSFRKIFSI